MFHLQNPAKTTDRVIDYQKGGNDAAAAANRGAVSPLLLEGELD